MKVAPAPANTAMDNTSPPAQNAALRVQTLVLCRGVEECGAIAGAEELVMGSMSRQKQWSRLTAQHFALPRRCWRCRTGFVPEPENACDTEVEANYNSGGDAHPRRWLAARLAFRRVGRLERTRAFSALLCCIVSFRSCIESRLFNARSFQSIQNCSHPIPGISARERPKFVPQCGRSSGAVTFDTGNHRPRSDNKSVRPASFPLCRPWRKH